MAKLTVTFSRAAEKVLLGVGGSACTDGGAGALVAIADLVITGEGRLDGQTAEGKVVSGVTARASRHGVPVWAVVGRSRATPDQVSALHLAGVLEAGTPAALSAAAARVLATVAPRPSA